MKKQKRIFYYLISLFSIFGIVQGIFYSLQTTQAQTSVNAIQALLRQENSSSNIFLISRTLSDLQESKLIKCVKLIEASTGLVHLDLSYKDTCGAAAFLLEGKSISTSLKSLNGAEWKIEFESINGQFFTISLWLARVLFGILALITVWYFIRREDRLVKEEQKKEKLKDLAAQAAHDVASPLSLLYALEASNMIPSDAKEMVRMVGDRVQGIVGNLKKQSTQIEDEATLKLEDVNLVEIIGKVVQEAKTRYEFTSWSPQQEDVVVKAQKDELARVISNLLNNAIEATVKTKKPIAVVLEEGTPVSLKIVDNGQGIPKHILHTLGSKGATYGKAQGQGLGLYNAKQCLEKWGGTLEIESKEGAGTTVVLKFR
ncbi:MAG: sensor histidine kinase [Pseudobdellovibrionaceae bacterium]